MNFDQTSTFVPCHWYSGGFDSVREPAGRVFRTLFVVLVFSAFPIWVFFTVFEKIETLAVERRIDALAASHQSLLTKILKQSNDIEMLRSQIILLSVKMKHASPEKQKDLVTRFNRAFPGMVDLYFFDRQLELETSLSSTNVPKRAIEKAMSALDEGNRKKTLTSMQKGILSSVFRSNLVSKSIDLDLSYILLQPRPEFTGIVWGRQEKIRKPFIAVFHQKAIPRNLFLNRIIGNVEKTSRRLRVGLYDPREELVQIIPESLARDSDVKRGVLASLARYRQYHLTDRAMVSLTARGDGTYILLRSPLAKRFSEKWGGTFLLFALGWSIFIFVRADKLYQGLGRTIPAKVVILFILIGGTPSSLLMLTGYYALKDHAHVMRENVLREATERLRQFDERFADEMLGIQESFLRVVRRATAAPADNQRREILHELSGTPNLEMVFAVDEDGKALYEFYPMTSVVPDQQKKLLYAIAQQILRTLTGSDKVDGASFASEAIFSAAGSLGGEHLRQVESFIRSLGVLRVYKIGEGSTMSVQEVLPDPAGNPKYLVHAQFNHSQVERTYCLKHINDLRRFDTLPIDLAMVSNSKLVGDVVPRGMLGDYVTYLADLSSSNRSTVHESRSEGDGNYIWIAMPTRKMSYFFLIGKVPLRGVEQRIQGMWHRLIAFSVMLLIAGVFVGFMISRQFLQPISDISTGLQAIARRDFRHRVPVRSSDELGEVGMLINRVTDGMKDLEVARVVQESLFPTESLDLPPVRLFGRSFAMADIGGDYFDYFVLADRYVVGLVGDVSGHGVSAALIMGMAKGAFAMHAKPGLSLIAFFESFNHLLISTAKKKKMMTLFAFAIDMRTLKMEYANAGHNYPMLYDAATGNVTELKAAGYPLGMRSKLVSSVQVLDLHQGDGIIMYTDGFVEARNPAEQEVGYQRFGEWFGEGMRQNLTAPALVENLFARFHDWCENEPVQDDVSLVALQIKT